MSLNGTIESTTKANNKTISRVRILSEADLSGSKGGPVKPSRTTDKFQKEHKQDIKVLAV